MMSAVAPLHSRIHSNELSRLEIERWSQSMPDVPSHALSGAMSWVADEVAGEYVARQCKNMTPMKSCTYQDAVRSIRTCGPLRRPTLVTATRVATGRESITSDLIANHLQLSNPFEQALASGLL